MKTNFSRKQLSIAVACALAFSFASGAVRAQGLSTNEREIWSDTSRAQIWKNGYGECWHSAFGPPPGYNECNPAPIAQYVAPAPAPYVAPVKVAAAPPAPVYQKFSFDADVLFAFDKSVLRPEGRAVLSEFAGKVKSVNPSSITAIGHADRFGTDSYNQSLSERRVLTVKEFLVNEGLSAQAIQTLAKGETQPVTKPGDCLGKKTAKVVACLQPDRRVDVEVVGTR